MRKIFATFILLLAFLGVQSQALTIKWTGVRPVPSVAKNGQLSVVGKHIVNEKGAVVSLAGPSLFWSNTGWGQEAFYNAFAVRQFAQDWQADVIRVAIGAQGAGSFIEDPHGNMARAETVIQAALANNIYVIVDFHSHQAERNIPQAEAMFRYIATKYGHNPHIIYEIYNEPLDTTDWDTVVKTYSERLIRTIRAIDPDNIILVGTQSWSQDLEKSLRNPIRGQSNIAYTLHFYAAGHKDDLRNRAQAVIDAGLPVFVSEWGAVNYDGDGDVDRASSQSWIEFMRRNQLSHTMWAASSKDEGASMFQGSAPKTGPWQDRHLRPSGLYARDIIRGWN